MKEIGPDGDLIFSSTDFGSGSVGKTAQIAQILSELLNGITITTRSEDIQLILDDYYKRDQIDNMLSKYVLLVNLTEEVSDQLTRLLNDPEFSGAFASKSDLNALNEVIKDYESTIATIKGNQTSLQSAWTEYKASTDKTIEYQNKLIDQISGTSNTLQNNYSSLSSSVTSLQAILNNLNLIELSEFSASITDINNKLDKIGDLSILKTSTKESLVAAINELVDKRGDLATLKTTNKTSIVTAINELFQSASDGKSLIAAAITGKGISAAASETFQSLANKISNISTGIDTSDADATASDIVSGKIAYANNQRLVGTHTCSSSGSSGDLSSKITVFDSSDHLTLANSTATIASGKAGIFICTYMNAICSSGDDLCYGTIQYVIDGTTHSTDEYGEGTKIQFNSSLVLKVGELIYESSGTTVCDYCGGDGVPVVQWGGVLVLE